MNTEQQDDARALAEMRRAQALAVTLGVADAPVLVAALFERIADLTDRRACLHETGGECGHGAGVLH